MRSLPVLGQQRSAAKVFSTRRPGQRLPVETFRCCFSGDLPIKLTDVLSLRLPDLRLLTRLWKMCWTVTHSRARWSHGADEPVWGRAALHHERTRDYFAFRSFAFMPQITWAEHLNGTKAFFASFRTLMFNVFFLFNSFTRFHFVLHAACGSAVKMTFCVQI